MKAEDFADQTEAEKKLIAHLREGKAGPCRVSDAVPPENANTRLYVRASLIRALALGQVEDVALPDRGIGLYGAYIFGDGPKAGGTKGLDFEGADLTKDIALIECHFADRVIMLGANARGVYLNGSYFAADFQADRLKASGGVLCRRVIMTGICRLLGSRIGGGLDFSNATFKCTEISLGGDGAEISGDLFLRDVISAGEVRFLGAVVRGDLDCSTAQLNCLTDSFSADGIEINGKVVLSNMVTSGAVRFPSAHIGGNFVLSGASLNGKNVSLNCEGAKIGGTWRFWGKAKAAGAIDLTAAEVGAIDDDPNCWPNELLLDRCRYGGFVGRGVSGLQRLDWLSRLKPERHSCDFWPQPYEECARVLREAGHGADARAVLIEKERLQRAVRREKLVERLTSFREKRDAASRHLGFRPFQDQVIGLTWKLTILWLWDHLLGAVVDYGRRPGKAALWLGLVLLIGWFVFARAAGFGEIKPNLPQIQRAAEWTGCRPPEGSVPPGERWEEGDSQVACFLRQPEAASYPRFDALIYSADTLLPIVSLEMQSYWIPDDRKPLGWWARLYLWLHIFSGWGLTLLAVAGFSGLIKTDNSK
ncbi:MAG: hypothetical protein ACK46Q_14010 [Hyphomonas sp.]